MNLKKLVSVLVASAMMVASAASLVTTSFATLLPIKEYDVTLTLNGYTDDELAAMPLSTVLDGLKYRYSYEIEVPVDDSTSNSSVTTSSDVVTPATKTVTVNAGDKVEIAPSATKVWVEDDTYSILDNNATVDLSDQYDSVGISYYRDIDIIVGSGKQLDPGNIRYNVAIEVNRHDYQVNIAPKVYTLDENGEKQYYSISFQEVGRISFTDGTTGSRNQIYLKDTFAAGDKLYIEPKAYLTMTDSNEEIDSDCSIEYQSRYTDEPNRMSVSDNYAQITATITFTAKGDASTELAKFKTYFYVYGAGLDLSYSLYTTNYNYALYTYRLSTMRGANTYTESVELKLKPGCKKDSNYILRFTNLKCPPSTTDLSKSVTKAVVGNYASSAEAADAADIKDKLFSSSYRSGYEADFSNGMEFTVFIDGSAVPAIITDNASEYVLHVNVSLVEGASSEGVPDVQNAFFNLNNVKREGDIQVPQINIFNRRVTDTSSNSTYSTFDKELDTIRRYNYQTVLLLDNEADPIDMTKLMLSVSSTEEVKVYNSVSGRLVKFDEEPQDLSKGEVMYTVAANGGQGNYYVNVVKSVKGGAKLYVPGGDEREVFLDSYYSNTDANGLFYYDIVVANIGDEALTGLNVVLEAPQNVKLDGYWVIGGDKNNTLSAFTLDNCNEVSNLAKIRLVQDGEGEVSGTLKITADGQDPKIIKLVGHAGNPKIVTDPELPDGVKFVPYYSVIATNNIYEWNKVTFELYGRLPKGVSFDKVSGEIYGVPQETGTFEFEVCAKSDYFGYNYRDFTLEILENTNENVYNASDEDYTLTQPIGYELTTGAHDFELNTMSRDQLFVSSGTYGDFIDLWINGVKMTPGEDYTSEEGSTRITIKSQTLQNLGNNTTNTIAAEFRVGGDVTNELKRTAQNFTINLSGNNPNPGSGSGSGSGSSTGGTSGSGSHSGSGTTYDQTLSDAIAAIDAIPHKVTLADKDKIEAARKAYDDLSYAQQIRISNYDDLVEAEKALAALEAAAVPETPTEPDTSDTATSDVSDVPDTDTTEASDVPAQPDKPDVSGDDDNDDQQDTAEVPGADDEEEVPSDKTDSVSVTFSFVDADGKAYPGLEVELHSDVKTGVTDKFGLLKFTDVEFGEHTLTVTNPETGETAVKEFTLENSAEFSVADELITASAGDKLSIDIMFDGSSLTFLSTSSDVQSGEESADDENPHTGVAFPAVGLCVSSAALVYVLLPRKKKV